MIEYTDENMIMYLINLFTERTPARNEGVHTSIKS